MKLFVWDFHGTLERDNELAVLKVTNDVLKQAGYERQMTEAENRMLYGRKWYEYFEYLLPEEPIEIHLNLQKECVVYESENPDVVGSVIKPNNFAHEVLEEIHKSEHDQILISNVSEIGLGMFLEAVNMRKFFPIPKTAFATNSHKKYGTLTKKDILKKYLKGKNFEEVIVIGDRGGDVELAAICGGISYLYSHPGMDFFKCTSSYRIRDLREVLKEV